MAKDEIINEIFLNEDALKNVPDKIIEEYEEFLKLEEIMSKNLIGDIKDDKYYIPDEIKKVLVKNKKLMTKREDDFLIAKMERFGVVFKFRLTFEKINEKDCLAKFYLLEDLGEDVRETFLAEFRDDYSYDFKQKARISFNIFLDEQEYKDCEDGDFKALDDVIIRNRLIKSDDRIFIEESYSETFIIDLLKELSKGGELSKKIISEYRDLIQKKGMLTAGTNHIYIKLKEILDAVVEKNGGYEQLAKENPGIKRVLSSYLNPIRDFDKTARKIEVITEKPNKETDKSKSMEKSVIAKAEKKVEKKKEEKKAEKKKSGGGAKKEDKPKKKEKKKEEKKKFIYPEPKKKPVDEEYKKEIKKITPKVDKQKTDPKNFSGLNEREINNEGLDKINFGGLEKNECNTQEQRIILEETTIYVVERTLN